MSFRHFFRQACSCLLALMLFACGGGGGGSSSTSTPTNTPSSDTPAALPVDYISSNIAANAISFGVQKWYGNNINIPYVSVTICQPGTSQCQTIGNILLDTGSSGLRVLSSALGSLQLSTQTNNGSPVLECASFLSGLTWGPVKTADIKMSSEIASSMPIQVIGDTNYLSAPNSNCNGLPALQDKNSLNANGILGVSLLIADNQNYFSCSSAQSSSCTPIAQARNLQVQNPIASFATNNNGLVMQMAVIGSVGASSATGILYFGVDTQSNNSSSGANIIPTNSIGLFTTTFNGVSYSNSFIDSGSNGLFFPAGNQSTILKSCTTSTGFYCPSTTQNYTASVPLKNNATGTINFSVANADSLLTSNNYAYSNLGGNQQGQFDWGLPFFYGKNVYFGLTGKSSANAGTGPYYGYK
jgi:Protein of unknown function (DUF3443)